MTSTSVVLGIATLGTPEATPGCDCATDTAGITAIRKRIKIFIGLSSRFSLVSFRFPKEYDRTLRGQKILLFREALYKEVPRLHQPLLTPLRGRSDAGHHQHPRHTGEQQPTLRQFFFSRLTRNKWQ